MGCLVGGTARGATGMKGEMGPSAPPNKILKAGAPQQLRPGEAKPPGPAQAELCSAARSP